ncbi:MAG: class I SAM-dependent methyltransferase [Candidatus Uhrbacteria bacterium]|nr:class I SAM-dependent methyltransferase [Candidatus Uhrbacteria bacterium]
MDHAGQQRAYFGRLKHHERFCWQTEDPFVMAREHQTTLPLVQAIQKLHERLKRPLRLLESGCGEGVNLKYLRQLGLDETIVHLEGVDFSPEAVTEAVSQGFQAQVADGLALPFADQSFDIVFCRDVLHHLENDDQREKFFSEMWRVARTPGLVAAIEPNPWNFMIFALSVFIPAEKGLRAITQSRLTALFPRVAVEYSAPSSAWRLLCHYRSPLRKRMITPFVHWTLTVWEFLCRKSPKRFWSYRIYLWNKPH